MDKGIFNELKNTVQFGKKTQKVIAKFFLAYDGDFRKLKILEVAEQTCTSAATIVRFSQELGYLGFPEMKIELQNQSRVYQGDDYSDGEKEERFNHIESLMESFKMTGTNNSSAQIFNIVSNIKDAKNIDIFAKGETNITAQDFALKLIRIGFIATAHLDSHTQHFVASNATKKTVAIGISYSGTSKDVLENLAIAKANGATTFLISKDGAKKPDFVDYVLNIMCTESGARVYSTISRLTILFLLDLIYLELIKTNPEFYHNKLTKTRIRGSR